MWLLARITRHEPEIHWGCNAERIHLHILPTIAAGNKNMPVKSCGDAFIIVIIYLLPDLKQITKPTLDLRFKSALISN